MKKANQTLAIILLVVIAGCGRTQSTDDFITVDVSKNYPEKILILQDFMDVEYIALETTDEFLTNGWVADIGEDFILVTNRNSDGNIYIYDRNGKGIRIVNRMGRGPEEYTFAHSIILDEVNSEIFVHDYSLRKIVVYDLVGTFKRSLKYNNDDEALRFSVICNYDRYHLICYDATGNYYDERPFCHVIISKQDGNVIQKIQTPYKENKSTMLRIQEGDVTFAALVPFQSILPYKGQWILAQPSSDTIYRCQPDFGMIPFIVRIPPIHSMNPEVFLSVELITEHYYFLMVSEKIAKILGDGLMSAIPQTSLMYDRQEKTLFKYAVYNGDFLNEKQVFMNSWPINDNVSACKSLGADSLVDAYKKGQLKGKLRDIAAALDENDNPVVMLIKNKP
ncbi:MAG: 6-bladed beta-propeller [Prevotellaceae bacterium]|jgi:hypothetical protein|nr:6-bladed beta-propeller [Prevotellaceae bacterium]